MQPIDDTPTFPLPHRRPRRRPLLLAVLIAAALVVSACGSSGPSPASSSSSGSTTTKAATGGATKKTVSVTIKTFAFRPDTVSVTPGATVSVTNEDMVTHTLTSISPGRFDTGDILPGQTKTFTAPTAPGTYPFDCSIHTFMTGTLIVS